MSKCSGCNGSGTEPEEGGVEIVHWADHPGEHVSDLQCPGRILGDFASEHVASAALNAVRDAIHSADPAVVRAMAERIGLDLYQAPECEVPDGR